MSRSATIFIATCLALLATTCKNERSAASAGAEPARAGGERSPYVGHWVNVGKPDHVLSITPEGEAFIVRDESRKQFVARLENGVLRVGTPMGGSIDILHVPSTDRLVGGGEEYQRVTGAQAAGLAERLDVTAIRRESMRRMREIATAWEARATDVNTYAVNDITSGEVPPGLLASALTPTYVREMPRTDGWNNPLLFAVSEHGMTYSIRSTGDTGQPDVTPVGATSAAGADILFTNGQFLSYPPGIE